ncbi:MAG: HD domain-containing protein [Lachnospiraceae bacterium]|nr:HD domain-containing protein [Lachnospiraceae bacterium]
MIPTREKAEELLRDAEVYNPGAWVEHSQVVAMCAEKIASACGDMDTEKAFVLGLLHDIGRKFGVKHMGHIYDGYHYMTELGYDEAARICLSHSFSIQKLEDYIGRWDIAEEQQSELRKLLDEMVYDDYDRLIQVCDSLAGTEVVDMEERMADVKRRYGAYPQDKWDKNLALKAYFEEKMHQDIYKVVGR